MELSRLPEQLSSSKSLPRQDPGQGGCTQPPEQTLLLLGLPPGPPDPSLRAAVQDGAKELEVLSYSCWWQICRQLPAGGLRARFWSCGHFVFAGTDQSEEMPSRLSPRQAVALSVNPGNEEQGWQ